jgi:hypothetical protein
MHPDCDVDGLVKLYVLFTNEILCHAQAGTS